MHKTLIIECSLMKFGSKGEKTSWTYILISKEQANEINPGVKKSYRVLYSLDQTEKLEGNLMPMGDGSFILPIKQAVQKQIKKKAGDKVKAQIKFNPNPYELNKDFIEFLETDEKARDYFYSMPRSHQNYYSKWVDSAKTLDTKAKRIAHIVQSLSKGSTYVQMLKTYST